MGTWQIAEASALALNSGLALVAWSHARETVRRARLPVTALPRFQQLVLRHGWVIALGPLCEAWFLGMGGFWS